MSINRLMLQDITALYKVNEWRDSLVVLIIGYPHDCADNHAALRTFRPYASNVAAE